MLICFVSSFGLFICIPLYVRTYVHAFKYLHMYTHESVCAVLGCLDVTLNFVLVHMYIRTYVYCMYVPCEKEFMTCF